MKSSDEVPFLGSQGATRNENPCFALVSAFRYSDGTGPVVNISLVTRRSGSNERILTHLVGDLGPSRRRGMAPGGLVDLISQLLHILRCLKFEFRQSLGESIFDILST